MRIGTNGVVVNEYGQVLLIRRNDTFTMAPPGGSVESGELPVENVTREVREETGLIVMAIRLVGVYTWRSAPDDVITFVFRCIRRGGELTPSEESPQVGFYAAHPLPGPMIPFHRHRIQQALRHDGGAPIWEHHVSSPALRMANFILRRIIYGFMNLRNRWRGLPKYESPPEWRVGAFAIVRDELGKVLWVKMDGESIWGLPGGDGHEAEPPWLAVARVVEEKLGLPLTLDGLSGVYHPEGADRLWMTFTATAAGKQLPAAPEENEWGYFVPGEEPVGANPHHKDWVVDATLPGNETVFKHQAGAA